MAAHPGAALIMAAYSLSKLATNALFNTDGIKKQYSGLQAMIEVEDLFFRVYENLREKYLSDQTKDNARDFVYSIDFVYRALDQDCAQSTKYVNAVEKGDGLRSWLFGNETYEESRKKIGNIQSSYNESHSNAQYGWILYLSEDYPGYGLEEYYLDLYQSDEYVKIWKEIRAACPVDIYVYDANGTLAASVSGGIVSCPDENVLIVRQGDEKMIRILSDEDYTIEYRGYEPGAMDVTVIEYGEDETVEQKIEYYDVPLTDTAAFSMEVDRSESAAPIELLDGNSNPLPKDVEGGTDGATAHMLSISCGTVAANDAATSDSEFFPGERVRISATVPSGFSFVRWESNSSQVSFHDSVSQSTYFTMPDEDVDISAILMMDDNLITDMAYLPAAGGDSVSVSVHISQNARVICALYNDTGRMLSAAFSEAQAPGDWALSFPVSIADAVEARLFVLSDGGIPLCESKMLSLH